MKYKVTLNGTTYEVEVSKDEAAVVEQYTSKLAAPVAAAVPAPMAAPAQAAPAAAEAAPPSAAPTGAGAGEQINSPLPGSVVGIKVAVGSAVKKNQVLLVIEAMKMENEVVATRDGTITGIAVSQGQSVDTGTLLLTLA